MHSDTDWLYFNTFLSCIDYILILFCLATLCTSCWGCNYPSVSPSTWHKHTTTNGAIVYLNLLFSCLICVLFWFDLFDWLACVFWLCWWICCMKVCWSLLLLVLSLGLLLVGFCVSCRDWLSLFVPAAWSGSWYTLFVFIYLGWFDSEMKVLKCTDYKTILLASMCCCLCCSGYESWCTFVYLLYCRLWCAT